MYTTHHDFYLPEDRTSRVWRYTDLAKFLSLLENRALYFTRADQFEDPFEGAVPKINLADMEDAFSEFKNAAEMKGEMLGLMSQSRLLTTINCWYQDQFESDAMWKLYSEKGIAIQTTLDRLIDSFQGATEKVFIGSVRYIDYETEGFQYMNAMASFLYKRKSFQHEREIRAVITELSNYAIDPKGQYNKTTIDVAAKGRFVATDLDMLIENIYISPVAPEWFAKLIETILKRYGLDKPVIHSKLYHDPYGNKGGKFMEVQSILVSNNLLEHYEKKDAYRANNEALQKERELQRIFDELKDQAEKLEQGFKDTVIKTFGAETIGKEALLMAGELGTTKEEAMVAVAGIGLQTLFMACGKADVLLRSISHSILGHSDKFLLERKVVFIITEYLLFPLTKVVMSIQEFELNTDALFGMVRFYQRITELIREKRY